MVRQFGKVIFFFYVLAYQIDSFALEFKGFEIGQRYDTAEFEPRLKINNCVNLHDATPQIEGYICNGSATIAGAPARVSVHLSRSNVLRGFIFTLMKEHEPAVLSALKGKYGEPNGSLGAYGVSHWVFDDGTKITVSGAPRSTGGDPEREISVNYGYSVESNKSLDPKTDL